jgi:hypothetical protein
VGGFRRCRPFNTAFLQATHQLKDEAQVALLVFVALLPVPYMPSFNAGTGGNRTDYVAFPFGGIGLLSVVCRTTHEYLGRKSRQGNQSTGKVIKPNK